MRINRVVIKNFRSIKSIEFRPKEICALVGENNAGKTNILAALNLLLGETFPSKRSLEASHYYNGNTSEPVFIGVEFEENDRDIQGIWCNIPWDGKSETKVKYRSVGTRNLSNEAREQCALVYLDANRNLEQHLGHSRWSIFGRIVRQLDEHFRLSASSETQEALEQSFIETRNLLQTDLYQEFETTFRAAFQEQIKRTTHTIEVDFRTSDPFSHYKLIRPMLMESGQARNTIEAGQGMRNLVLLALFRTYAKVFKDDAIIAIEEPEIYLHPQAQRSLFSLFHELASNGGQVFYSTHSGNFINVEYFDHICLVDKCLDNHGDLGTQTKQLSVVDLLDQRQALHPTVPMTELSIRERYRNICDLEHNEAFFANQIVLVEGDTEEYAIPIYASAMGHNFDALGVAVVNAHGKHNLDQLYQMYKAFETPIYLVFDNDRGGKPRDIDANLVLLRMLEQPEVREPDAIVGDAYAILEGNFEKSMKAEFDEAYVQLETEAKMELGDNAGKGLIARHMAFQLTRSGTIPEFLRQIIEALLGSAPTPSGCETEGAPEDLPF